MTTYRSNDTKYLILFFVVFNFGKISESFAKTSRPLTSERPSKSDSAYTLNRFQAQIEASLFSQAVDKNNYLNSKSNLKSYFEYLTIRFGISDSTEIQYIDDGISFYKKRLNNINYHNNHGSSGDKFIRIKRNIIGNDEGSIGLAITPFYKVDNAQDILLRNDLRAGVVAPFHLKINSDYTFGGMYQINYYKTTRPQKNNSHKNNSQRYNQYIGIINSYYISRNINEKLSSYLEFYSLKTLNVNKFLKNYINIGTNYLLSDNVKIDCGVNFGVSQSANDMNYFSGLTWRF